MGVLACNRYGCPHIMCDKCSTEYGYLCNSCFEELVQNHDAATDIWKFLDTEAGMPRFDSREYFSNIFRNREEII